ncbi:MFS transporter [Neisseriaceae bacterium CLB008]|nr:MFS transporter [Neisseriaceae bacterium]
MQQHSIVQLIDEAPISRFQWRILVLCFLIAIFDGFDTQAIAFTGPEIIQYFQLTSGELAPIMTAGTMGMVLGAMVLGIVGDRIGRRPALLGAVLVFGVATFLTAFVNHTQHILILRFIAGLGMGGATPVVLSLAAEYSPHKHRGTSMTVVLLGLPAGAIIGGLLAAKIMPFIGWQGIFLVGGIAPMVLLLVLVFALPESLHHMALKSGNEGKINAILHRIVGIKRPEGDRYLAPEAAVKASVAALLSKGLARNTVAIWLVYFFNWVSWFLLLSWLPTVLKVSGLAATQAPMGTVVVNSVFILCALPLAAILPKFNVRSVLMAMFGLGIAVCFGLYFSGNLWFWVFVFAGLAGLGIGGQQIVLNYMVAKIYPTNLRASATGWAIGCGRIGAILGAASGGLVLDQAGPSGFYLALIVPLLFALLALLLIKPRPEEAQPQPQTELQHETA